MPEPTPDLEALRALNDELQDADAWTPDTPRDCATLITHQLPAILAALERAERVEGALVDASREHDCACKVRAALAAAPAEEPCPTCDGCGQVADTERQEPWTAWANLPPGSDAAVRMGLVKPIPCPTCAAPPAAEGER